jgi:hypothetical protein
MLAPQACRRYEGHADCQTFFHTRLLQLVFWGLPVYSFGENIFGYVWLRTEVMGDLKENTSRYLLFSPSCSRYLWPGTGQLLLAGPFYVRELAKILRGYF